MAIRATYKQISPLELRKLLKDPGDLFVLLEDPDLPELDLDKAWDDIHLLLTGNWNRDGTNLSKAIFGSTIFEDEEDGFNEATENYTGTTFLTVSEVKEIAQALKQVSEEELQKRIAADNKWIDYGEPEEQLLPYFRNILSFYCSAANHNKCVLIDIG